MQKTIEPKTTASILALTLAVFLASHHASFGAVESPSLIEGARKEGNLMIYSLLAVPDHSRIVNRFKD
jgi:hypothetical protein